MNKSTKNTILAILGVIVIAGAVMLTRKSQTPETITATDSTKSVSGPSTTAEDAPWGDDSEYDDEADTGSVPNSAVVAAPTAKPALTHTPTKVEVEAKNDLKLDYELEKKILGKPLLSGTLKNTSGKIAYRHIVLSLNYFGKNGEIIANTKKPLEIETLKPGQASEIKIKLPPAKYYDHASLEVLTAEQE